MYLPASESGNKQRLWSLQSRRLARYSASGVGLAGGGSILNVAAVRMVRPAHDAARLLGCVVDARLFGVHVGAVHDCYARHALSLGPSDFVCRREDIIDVALARAVTRNAPRLEVPPPAGNVLGVS